MNTLLLPEADANADKAPTYALELTGDGVSISRQVSQAVALQIIAITMGGASPAPISTVPASDKPRRTSSGQVVAIREFLNDSGAKRNPDKIVAIAIYLRDHLNRETFSRDDVKGLFRKAGEPAPGNYARDFAVAVSAGWIAEDHATSGEYYVTNAGLQTLDEGFQAKSTPGRRKRTKSVKSKNVSTTEG